MDVIELPLKNGGVTLIDAHLLDTPLTYNFRDGRSGVFTIAELNWSKRKNRNFYYAFSTTHGGLSLARLVTQCPPDCIADHQHHDTLNNALDNLRICTIKQNSWNTAVRYGRSQYRGVKYSPKAKHRPWIAQVNMKVNGKNTCRSVGSFATEIEAALAWDAAVIELRGEWANPNFPAAHGAPE
ncbi:MAG: hypothetical protein IT367_13890 [Candidatus Hydrogenedentes bacterium]|nr:hypothetical protein [Candidatus Hydrogenedentota bacterium]